MKKYKYISVMLCLMLSCTACGGDKEPALEAITLSNESIELATGEDYQLSANLTPSTIVPDALQWSSTDETVVQVVDGNLTPVAEGTATIQVQYQDCVDSCEVTVIYEEIILSSPNCNMYLGQPSKTFQAYVKPNNDVTVEWVSEDESIATVKDGEIASVAEGNTTVIARTEHGTEAKCAVSVKVPTAYDLLTNDEKALVTHLENGIDFFKDPSSVVVMSIEGVGYDHDSFVVNVRANNSFGGLVGDTVYISYYGIRKATDDEETYGGYTMNIPQINAALQEYYEAQNWK